MSEKEAARAANAGGDGSHAVGLANTIVDAAPVCNATTATEFLERFRPGGPWVLAAAALQGDGKLTARAFDKSTREPMARWIADQNRNKNIYFHVNPTLQALSKKASKTDVAAVTHLHVDTDPRKGEDLEAERARLLCLHTEARPKDTPPPSVLIDSGGGLQAFWLLRDPLPVNGEVALAEAAECYTRELEKRYGADACHDVCRIMRLPGTVNWPNETKRAKGRVPRLAQLISFDADLSYSLDDFHFTESPEPGAPEPPTTHQGDANGLNVPDRIMRIVRHGRDPEEGAKVGDDSRSAWLFDGLCGLARAGVSADEMLGLITDPANGISASVLDKGRTAERYARRQIERACEAASNFDLRGRRPDPGSARNIRLALSKMGVEVEYDEFADRLMIRGLPAVGPKLDDAALDRLWLSIDERFGFQPRRELFQTVVRDVAHTKGRRHPVREYLERLVWDGQPRLDTWLVQYGGAADTPYVRAVGGITLIAAVRRVRQPGVKFDEMLVLESAQGTDKSSALAVLAVHEDWFSDDLPLNTDTKRVIESLSGHWIVEAAELAGMRKGDIDHLKAFLSRQFDRARLAYDRMRSDTARQCVIIGTTNSEKYLRDATGHRRFWPVKVTRFDLASLVRDRDQLWAEAASREAAGESIRLDAALWAEAAREQARRELDDPFGYRLENKLQDIKGKLRAEDALLIVGVQPGARTDEHSRRVGTAMKKLGWQHRRLRFGGPSHESAYVRGSEAERLRRIQVTPLGDDVTVHVVAEIEASDLEA